MRTNLFIQIEDIAKRARYDTSLRIFLSPTSYSEGLSTASLSVGKYCTIISTHNTGKMSQVGNDQQGLDVSKPGLI